MDAYCNDPELKCTYDETKDGGREVVKIGDSEEDIRESRVHLITVNHHQRRVDVTFRGSSTVGDWGTNLNAIWRVSPTVFR